MHHNRHTQPLFAHIEHHTTPPPAYVRTIRRIKQCAGRGDGQHRGCVPAPRGPRGRGHKAADAADIARRPIDAAAHLQVKVHVVRQRQHLQRDNIHRAIVRGHATRRTRPVHGATRVGGEALAGNAADIVGVAGRIGPILGGEGDPVVLRGRSRA